MDPLSAVVLGAADGLTDHELLACRAWLAALRGDTATVQSMLAGLADVRASEDAGKRQ